MRYTGKGPSLRARHSSSSGSWCTEQTTQSQRAFLVGAGRVVLQAEHDPPAPSLRPGIVRVRAHAHRHQVDALADPLGVGLHVPGLHVQGDAEVLGHHHPVGHDLHLAAPVGQQLGGRGGLVEPELVDHHHPALGIGPALEDVADVDHPRVVAGPPRPGRPGPGGHDHRVGLLGLDLGPGGRGAGDQLHAQPPGGHHEVAGDVEELGPAGDGGGHLHLAAEAVVPLEQGHPVPPLGRGHRGLQPAGAAADHHHPPAPAGGGEDGRLASGPRVLDAAEPAVEAHATDALLVAGETGADVGGVARAGLGREVGIGDLAPDHADQIAQPVVEGAVGLPSGP